MTYREKFKAVFGVDVDDACEINWDKPYRNRKNYKTYRVTLMDGGYGGSRCKEICSCTVKASNETNAKKEAKDIFGYRMCYYDSGKPMTTMRVQEVTV